PPNNDILHIDNNYGHAMPYHSTSWRLCHVLRGSGIVIGYPLTTAIAAACFQCYIRPAAVDGMDMVDNGCGIVCSSSFGLQYVSHL
ncbi:MAG TPA: hypothetical protein PLT23_10110, partial [Lentisphaeria bacterium]|nr:hypothetical protein [Lentisphaeria bacterium]